MTTFARRALVIPIFVAVVAGFAPGAPEPAKIPVSDLVTAKPGACAIILSAPHGGTKDVPDVPPRKGEGLAKGGAGFFAGRDTGTEELADALVTAIEKAVGKKPYLVAAKFHRKFIDANRPPEIAYEDAKAKPTYDAYRQTLGAYCKEVKKTYGRGLLLDVHGQGRLNDTVIRGTQNGKTVALLTKRFGEKAHTGPKSFFGLLAADGVKVYPADLTDKEYEGLNGGNIVQTYGSEEYGIDAIQLEFGNDFREKKNLTATADKIAAAVKAYSELYLTNKE